MTNIELFELINEIRQSHGENKIRLNDFNTRIVDELDGEHYETFVVQNPNRTTSIGINLSFEQCTLIGMRETKGVRRSVIETIKKLESQIARPVMDLNNPEFLRTALLGYTEKVIELEHKVEKLEPKAQALDVIADTTNTYTIRDCAKTIGIQESKLIDFMLSKHWVYRENSKYRRLCAYSQTVDKKLMINKVSQVVTSAEGDKVFTQARITAFGLTRLTGMVKKAGLIK
ncbi:phage antirepressor KilAC domain-containing protein [Acinetobacter gerneri]|uniref:phage antirepressor KilAC domain-containing protein n=1 Tax=Acinetobacter gerneri TaxID=202952 RepID=UPI0032151C74